MDVREKEPPAIIPCLVNDNEVEDEPVSLANRFRKLPLEARADPTDYSEYAGCAFSNCFRTSKLALPTSCGESQEARNRSYPYYSSERAARRKL
ncbi:unnamed protein product [Clonostachys rosea f. rosea IK726]|uniref:Uncharacterized protein n=1 Tax=Clonostachys rosea f. rosea IK726 TaxID=1349383 RepID=A0ACA9TYG2_BIOOC|nr:unnamed protein product [Clonostachys rosea f. rosea IK726]